MGILMIDEGIKKQYHQCHLENKYDLMKHIKENSYGVLRKDIRRCYSDVNADIGFLLKDKKIFLIKDSFLESEKDVIFYLNDMGMSVDDDIVALWRYIKLPISRTEMCEELVKFGIKPFSK